MKKYKLLFFLLLSTWTLAAQTILSGKLTDQETGEDIIYATVTLYQNDVHLAGTFTDFDGNYQIELEPGIVDVEFSYIGYQTHKIIGVVIKEGQHNRLDFAMSISGYVIPDCGITHWEWVPPLIDPHNTGAVIYTAHDLIRNSPCKDIPSLVSTVAGISLGQ